MKIHTTTIDDTILEMGYKVVTENMESLGLAKNPTILTYKEKEWYSLDKNEVSKDKADSGGIWLARVPSGAYKVQQYMKEKHNQKTKVFKTAVKNILFVNDYRMKVQEVYLFEEI